MPASKSPPLIHKQNWEHDVLLLQTKVQLVIVSLLGLRIQLVVPVSCKGSVSKLVTLETSKQLFLRRKALREFLVTLVIFNNTASANYYRLSRPPPNKLLNAYLGNFQVRVATTLVILHELFRRRLFEHSINRHNKT